MSFTLQVNSSALESMQWNSGFAKNSDFLIPKSLQQNGVDLQKLRLWILFIKKSKFETLRCKDIVVRKSEFAQNLISFIEIFVQKTNF